MTFNGTMAFMTHYRKNFPMYYGPSLESGIALSNGVDIGEDVNFSNGHSTSSTLTYPQFEGHLYAISGNRSIEIPLYQFFIGYWTDNLDTAAFLLLDNLNSQYNVILNPTEKLAFEPHGYLTDGRCKSNGTYIWLIPVWPRENERESPVYLVRHELMEPLSVHGGDISSVDSNGDVVFVENGSFIVNEGEQQEPVEIRQNYCAKIVGSEISIELFGDSFPFVDITVRSGSSLEPVSVSGNGSLSIYYFGPKVDR